MGERIRNAERKMAEAGAREAQPFLEAGEQVQAVFRTQTGPHPMGLSPFGRKFYVVVVTDRNIVLLNAGKMGGPKGVFARLPRVPIGTPEGRVFGTVTIGGERHWVVQRYFDDVALANAALAADILPAGSG